MASFRMPRLDGRELAAIFIGGCIGALGRAGLAVAAAPPPGHWPRPTFALNIAGGRLPGSPGPRLQERLPLSAYRRPLLGTGLCGALTTFSAMPGGLLQMLHGGRSGLAPPCE